MSDSTPQPGATYRFVVRSADEAVRTIRERLGENSKVLSVRQLEGRGLTGLFGKPKLEVIAQVAVPEPEVAPLPATVVSADSNDTEPVHSSLSPFLASAAAPAARVAEVALARANQRRDALPTLPELLRRSGFSESILGRLQTSSPFVGYEHRPLHHSLVEVGQHLRREAARRPARPLPARTAFIGTPGVGRTTALCKWLAREVFSRQRMGRVVKAEFDKPNPAEGLAVFCEALGLGLEYYAAPDTSGSPAAGAAQSSLAESEGSFLYADLPGLSLRSPAENASMTRFLEQENFAGRVLVLNAAYELPMLRRAYSAGRDLGATHLIFTHLDELDHWGKLWDFLLEGELTPLFLATGPSLTGDCEEDTVGAVLRRTLPGA